MRQAKKTSTNYSISKGISNSALVSQHPIERPIVIQEQDPGRFNPVGLDGPTVVKSTFIRQNRSFDSTKTALSAKAGSIISEYSIERDQIH